MKTQTLSIRISAGIYRQLKDEIGKGKISKFIEKVVAKELNSQSKKLAREYQEAAQDKKRWKEAQEWEQAQMTDWDKRDDEEGN